MADLKRTRLVPVIIKRGVYSRNQLTLGAVNDIQLLGGTPFIRIPPLTTSRVIQLQLWWGFRDTINDDELLEMFLKAVDADNLPDATTCRFDSEWQTASMWEKLVVSTGVGEALAFVQTLDHTNLVFFGSGVSNVDLETRTSDFIWGFLMTSPTHTALKPHVQGTLAVEIVYIERSWGSDAYTWNGDFDEKNSEGISEMDMDVI